MLQELVDKIEKRLAWWRAKLLSQSDMLKLIKPVTQSLKVRVCSGF